MKQDSSMGDIADDLMDQAIDQLAEEYLANNNMATKKTTTKKPAEVGWDKAETVKASPQKETKPVPPVANDVPFGSPSKLTEAIAAARAAWEKGNVTRNGVSTSPTGETYNYYLTEDVMQFFTEHFKSSGHLDTNMRVEAGMNIITLTLDLYRDGYNKRVEANLGSPTSMSDFGARITYAPKYLLAIMFGISIQTDSDAFGTGVNKTTQQHGNTSGTTKPNQGNPTNNSSVPNPVTPAAAPVAAQPNISNNSSASVDNVGERKAEPVLEHSQSYPVAKKFIEDASSVILLDQAETKVENASKLFDHERAELKELIQTRRSELK